MHAAHSCSLSSYVIMHVCSLCDALTCAYVCAQVCSCALLLELPIPCPARTCVRVCVCAFTYVGDVGDVRLVSDVDAYTCDDEACDACAEGCCYPGLVDDAEDRSSEEADDGQQGEQG